MKKLILTFALLLVAQFGFSQAVDEAFKKDVLKVIERSGSGLGSYKKQILANIPEDKHVEFSVEFDGLIAKANDLTAKIYMEEYSKEDIKAILAFYESAVGKKMSEKAPVIMEKSQASMMELQGEIQSMMMKYMQ